MAQFPKHFGGNITAWNISQKLAGAPQAELRDSRGEISAVRASLANARNEVPGFWRSSFEIITLLSKASSTQVDFAKLIRARPVVFDDVTFNGVGPISAVMGSNVILKNHVQGMIFRNSVIRFDPRSTFQ